MGVSSREGEMNMKVVLLVEAPADSELCGYDGPGWYFWDEPNIYCHGPFGTKHEAERALRIYLPEGPVAPSICGGDRGKR